MTSNRTILRWDIGLVPLALTSLLLNTVCAQQTPEQSSPSQQPAQEQPFSTPSTLPEIIPTPTPSPSPSTTPLGLPSPLPQPSIPAIPASLPTASDVSVSPQAQLPSLPGISPNLLSGEILRWNGKSWQVVNNWLYRGRFEKYLNNPEENSADDLEYASVIESIMEKLAPAKATTQSIDAAFSLLPQAAAFPSDAGLCDALANQVYSVWLARRENTRLASATAALEEQRRRVEWNMKMAADARNLSNPAPRSGEALAVWSQQEAARRKVDMQPLVRQLGEITALLKKNEIKQEVSLLQSKIEFQALLLQLFLQRRFEHVLIGTRFYRSMFPDGEQQIKLGETGKNLFADTSGLPPTVNTLDTIAREAIQDVVGSVESFKFLVSNGELDSASSRLSEAYVIGEHLRPIRMLPRSEKRKVLAYYQKSQDLITALDVKAYDQAAILVDYLTANAKDFDGTRARSAIKTADTAASMHLAKAKNAAVSGDKATFEEELKQAADIWPTNPALTEVASTVFNRTDVQQRALVDFDQLVSQRNHRRIFEEQVRFIAATVNDSQRQEQLRSILLEVNTIDAAILKSQEIERRGDDFGAWESIERAFQQFPDDQKLSSIRSTLTTKAAPFVAALNKARKYEDQNNDGSSLAWYLKAQAIYPGSEYAKEGIERVIVETLPDASSSR